MRRKTSAHCLALVAVVAILTGCDNPPQLIVYAALDEDFSQPLLNRFTAQSGIEVATKFDTEAHKTVGLAQAILAERSRPRCDVFWNNEILNTIRLQRAGVLRGYRSPAGRQFPQTARSSAGYWYGFAARARILLVNTDVMRNEEHPTSIEALSDRRFAGRCGIARPLFGTTATHAAVLFATWGSATAEEFFRKVHGTARVLPGNKQVALAVGSGRLAFGLTDTDDALIEIEKGMPVKIIYPDQQDGGLGTLFIPNTLCLIANSPHPRAAEALLEFLLNPEVESLLADGRSGQIPLHPSAKGQRRVRSPREVRSMNVDWDAAADRWDSSRVWLVDRFAGE